ncbi:hypothetical protein [Chamaesiphon sp. VAR_48_metabat_403]|uniref:hypothetical protein n=1 Tax=Chamaesiphon sp. VAR_48_metabat_403 TaxID=2964700 RepID=UPI00286EA34C|nr:hypothetical protein [Chamaesiphon sp. VAR_48_metabat_403]
MAPTHQQKIYLDLEYHCPCHLNGTLRQIVLTEAFGCDRCHRIFVLQEDGLEIEELAATYPYKRRYYWNGNRFQILRSLPTGNFWTFIGSRSAWIFGLQCLSAIGLLIFIVQLYCRATLTSPILNLVLSITIAIIVPIAIVLWLFDRG